MEKEIAERNSNGKEAEWELTNQNNSVPLFLTRAPHDDLSQPQRNSLDRGYANQVIIRINTIYNKIRLDILQSHEENKNKYKFIYFFLSMYAVYLHSNKVCFKVMKLS